MMAVRESVTAEFIYLLNENVIQENFHDYSNSLLSAHCFAYCIVVFIEWKLVFSFILFFFSTAIFNIISRISPSNL